MSKASEDLPEPDSPVITISRSRGSSRLMSLRLWVRAPRMLIVWGKNDPFFTVEGAKAFQRDLPAAELHLLDAGHFALEEHADVIAEHVTRFLKTAERRAA